MTKTVFVTLAIGLFLLCGFVIGKITGDIPSVADTNSLFYEKRCGTTPSSGKVLTAGDFFLIHLDKDAFEKLRSNYLSTTDPFGLPRNAPFWWKPAISNSTVFLKAPGMTPRSKRLYIYSPDSQILSYYYASPSWRE